MDKRKEIGAFLNQFTNTYQVDRMCKTTVLVIPSPLLTVHFIPYSCNVITVHGNFVLEVILLVLEVKRIKVDTEINFSVYDLIYYSGVICTEQS